MDQEEGNDLLKSDQIQVRVVEDRRLLSIEHEKMMLFKGKEWDDRQTRKVGTLPPRVIAQKLRPQRTWGI